MLPPPFPELELGLQGEAGVPFGEFQEPRLLPLLRHPKLHLPPRAALEELGEAFQVLQGEGEEDEGGEGGGLQVVVPEEGPEDFLVRGLLLLHHAADAAEDPPGAHLVELHHGEGPGAGHPQKVQVPHLRVKGLLVRGEEGP